MSSRRSESGIESWLNERMKELSGISYKFVSPGNPGVPDRIYILPGGVVYFVELKTETGRLASIQKWQGERICRMGCRYRVIRGMDEARDFVKEAREACHTN